MEIGKEFGRFWSSNSENSNFSDNFILRKQNAMSRLVALDPCEDAIRIETNINLLELTSTLMKLNGKTPGMDRISYIMLKMLPTHVKERILKLYNNIFENFIPQQFKNSVLIPVLKPGNNRANVKSYRPISLNSCLSKLLDKIMANRLWWFVTSNKLLNNRQFGFKKGSSTIDALLYVDY